MKKLLFLCAPLLLAASLLSAQGEKVPRRVLLAVTVQPDASFTEADRQMISRSLLVKLQAASTDLVLVESPEAAPSGDPRDLLGAARDAGADVALTITLGGGWPSMTLRVRSFDLLENQRKLDLSVKRDGLSSFADLAVADWSEISSALAETYHMVDAPPAPQKPPLAARLTVKARPGTTVTGLGPAPLLVGADGSASRDLPAPREYALRAELSGYRPDVQRIFLATDREITVDQRPESRWAITASLQNFGYPTVDASWFVAPDGMFVRMGLTSYGAGIALNDTLILYSAPLLHLVADMGFYLAPEDSLFRPYTGAGAFLRVLVVPGAFVGLDPISAWGVRMFFGADIPSPSRNRAFLEWTPTIYITKSPTIFAASLGSDNVAPGWVYMQGGVMNILSFRVGFRWFL